VCVCHATSGAQIYCCSLCGCSLASPRRYISLCVCVSCYQWRTDLLLLLVRLQPGVTTAFMITSPYQLLLAQTTMKLGGLGYYLRHVAHMHHCSHYSVRYLSILEADKVLVIYTPAGCLMHVHTTISCCGAPIFCSHRQPLRSDQQHRIIASSALQMKV
jgi:hypothetical protein